MTETLQTQNHTSPHTMLRLKASSFILLALQLLLVLAVGVWFRVELERGFFVAAILIFFGFVIHTWLPLPARVPFFLALSIAAIIILLHVDGLWLILLGLALLGLCHLRMAWGLRLLTLLGAAVPLAALRLGWGGVSWSNTVIPILASLFMFRTILYMYDLKTDNTQASPWTRIVYFFMLPNFFFPLFPVIDYRTFVSSYYDRPAQEIYDKGVIWILRGVIHLLLYRLLYYMLPMVDAANLGVVGIIAFMAMTYGLYLRVSGLFHIIIGSVCMFGFNLPVTNNNYFLASSFTDLWRRINIYWKDFMMKVVFYPVFMWGREWSINTRLIAATCMVFIVTWFLHSYQWFWLQGRFPVTGTDIAFWGVLGVALAANTLWEARSGRRRVGSQGWSWRQSVNRGCKIVAVFCFMAVLWSLWDSGSFQEWGYRLLRARESGAGEWAVLIGCLLTAVAAVVLGDWVSEILPVRQLEGLAGPRQAVWVSMLTLGLILLGTPSVYSQLGKSVTRVVVKVRSTGPNQIDQEKDERGYYEALSRATQFGPMPAVGGGSEDENWVNLRETKAVQQTDDIRGWALVPNISIIHKGATFSTNSLGLRDRDYELEKMKGVIRFAFVGSSHVMGAGVDNDQTFENILEHRLNTEWSQDRQSSYEIMNFGVGGYGALQCLYVIEHIVPRVHPNIVVYFAHPEEERRLIDRLSEIDVSTKLDTSFEFVARAMKEADAHPGLPSGEFKRRIDPYSDRLLRWAYQEEVRGIGAMDAVPIVVLLPLVEKRFSEGERQQLTDLAREAGAIVIDLSDVYSGQDAEAISISRWDHHPNPEGHELIASRLYSEFTKGIMRSVVGIESP